MNLDQIILYIRQQQAAGVAPEVIRQALVAAGWKQEDVDASFAASASGAVIAPNPSANTSGQGAAAIVPEEIKGWSWGAFGFNWIWGVFNNTYIALLMFIPFVNFVMWIILGVKGNEWAWRNKRWDSVEHFKRVQHKWARAWVILLCVEVLLIVVAIFGIIAAVGTASQSRTKGRDAMRMSGLHQTQIALEMYSSEHEGKYPMSLGELPAVARQNASDPITLAPYSYTAAADGASYTLCARFGAESPAPQVLPNERSTFSNGTYCLYSSEPEPVPSSTD